MRIELHDRTRAWIGRIEVDATLRPVRVAVVSSQKKNQSNEIEHAKPTDVFLNWDTAIDDGGHLRKCVVCDCPDLYSERSFPLATVVIVILAFTGAAVGFAGLATNLLVLSAMAVVLVSDIAILIVSRRRLVCYRCRTSYHDIPMARYHRSWDRSVADRYPAVRRSDSAVVSKDTPKESSIQNETGSEQKIPTLGKAKAS